MDRPMRFKIGIGVVFALIILIIPAAATLRAENATKPMMSHDFTDVPVVGQEFMEPYINEFFHLGITGGCSTSPLMYCPTNPVTRGSMAVFMGRALGYVDMETDGYDARAYFKNTETGTAPIGLVASSVDGRGLLAISETGRGVHGFSETGNGVLGVSNDGIGVLATSTSTYGLHARSFAVSGLLAQAGTNSSSDTTYDIVLAESLGEIGGELLHFFSNDDFVIDLDDNTDGTDSFNIRNGINSILFSVSETGAATFNGNVQINGNYTATGSKSAIVDTVSYGRRAMYAVEATEVLFEDVGRGQLADGEAVIEIDPIFAETVTLNEEYEVFLTPIGDPVLLYIEVMTSTSFTVRSADGSDVQFSYRIVAKRLGYEDVRMEEVGD